MKKILTITILLISAASCTTEMHTWQQAGTYKKYGKAYVFEPYEHYHLFDTSKAFPDTVYKIKYSKRKPGI